MGALYDAHKWEGGKLFGTMLWNPFLQALDAVIGALAPLNHSHAEPGGEVAQVFGTAAERAALEPTAPVKFDETDTGDGWFYPGGEPFDSGNWIQTWHGAGVDSEPFSVDAWTPDPDYPPRMDDNGHGVLFPGDVEARMTSTISDIDTGKDFGFELHAAPVDTSAGDAKFSLDFRAAGNGDNLDTAEWANIGTVTLTLAATAYQKTSGTFGGSLDAGDITAGDLVELRLARDPDDAADTAGDAVAVKLRVIPATPE